MNFDKESKSRIFFFFFWGGGGRGGGGGGGGGGQKDRGWERGGAFYAELPQNKKRLFAEDSKIP